jgi:hypothetical protein
VDGKARSFSRVFLAMSLKPSLNRYTLITTISKDLGFLIPKIRAICNALDITIINYYDTRFYIANSDIQRIRQYIAMHMNITQCAKKLGTSTTIVRNICRELDIVIKELAIGKHVITNDEYIKIQQFLMNHRNNDKYIKITTCAKILNISTMLVRDICRQLGIDILTMPLLKSVIYDQHFPKIKEFVEKNNKEINNHKEITIYQCAKLLSSSTKVVRAVCRELDIKIETNCIGKSIISNDNYIKIKDNIEGRRHINNNLDLEDIETRIKIAKKLKKECFGDSIFDELTF